MKDLLAIFAIMGLLSVFESKQHAGSQPPAGTLRVRVTGLRNDTGKISASLFGTRDGFPEDVTKAFRTTTGTIQNRESMLVFENVPRGEYAIALLHDENENEKMDKNLVGIPKEGYGISNNVKAVLKAPSFEEARFVMDNEALTLEIQVRYF
jgi:uncharacterized protein (DUF2141 family)